jgi:replicative DNA helicase
MLAQPTEVIDDASEKLRRSDFFVPAHHEIFRCLTELWNEKSPIDVLTAHQWLSDHDLAERVGSPGILGEFLVGFATHLNVGKYIAIVKGKSLLRAAQDACTQIVRDIHENPEDVAGVIDRAESRILSVQSSLQTDDILDAKASVADFRTYLAEVEAGTRTPMLATGIRNLDAINGGFPIPGYVVIAGPPGGGKSAMMMTLNENWASQGIGVGNFSLEMTNRKLIQRRVANRAKMDSRTMNGRLDLVQKARVNAALDDIEDTPFWVDETSNLIPADLRYRTRKMVKAGAKVIILDYVQLLRGSEQTDRKVEQLREASRTISTIQKEFGILFIVLAQLKQSAIEDGNYKTTSLADCKGIGDDARAILMMEPHPDAKKYPLTAQPLIGRLTKVSDGSDGDVMLTFNKIEQRIS